MIRSSQLIVAIGLALMPTANASASSQPAAREVVSPTSDVGCAVRMMLYTIISKGGMERSTDPADQASSREHFDLANRGLAFFAGRLDAAPASPNLRDRFVDAFEGMRGLSSDEFIEQAEACIKIWKKSEDGLLLKLKGR